MHRNKSNFGFVLWYSLVALVGLILLVFWEKFNYVTTDNPLTIVFGEDPTVHILSAVVIGVDILFMSHIVMRAFVWKSDYETVIDAFFEDKVATSMSVIWGATTFIDMFLTWFWGAGRMEVTGVNALVPDVMHKFMVGFPLGAAILSWVGQGALIITTTRSIQLVVAMMSGRAQLGNVQQSAKFTPRQPQQVQHVPHNGNKQQQQNKPKPIPRPTGYTPNPKQQPTYTPVNMNRPEPSYYPPEGLDITNNEPLDFN